MKALIFTLILMPGLNSQALRCTDLTSAESVESQILDIAERAEGLMVSLNDIYTSHPELAPILPEVIFRLSNGVEKILDFDSKNEQSKIFLQKFEALVLALETKPVEMITKIYEGRIKLESDSSPIGPKVSAWDSVVDSPKTIVAEQTYTVKRNDGSLIVIKFSDKVTRKVLHSTDPFLIEAMKKTISAIKNVNDAGLLKVIGHSDVYKINHLGKTGNFRLYGYLHNGVFNMVVWSTEAEHTTSNVRRAVDATRSARLARRH